MSKKDFVCNIREFNMKSIKNNSIVVLLGKRNTGKSFLVKDILYHKRQMPLGVVISRTDHLTHFFDKFIPSMLIHKRYTSEIVENLFKRQEKAIADAWPNPYTFLLFDDCLSDAASWRKDERIKEIFFNGRHYKVLFILTMQAPLGIPPDLRTNIDFTFILKNNNAADREKIYRNYAGVFPSKEIFGIILDNCTEDYNALVIDNTAESNKIEDQVFYYKASAHDNLRLFSDAMWQKNSARIKRANSNHCDVTTSVVRNNQRIIINKTK